MALLGGARGFVLGFTVGLGTGVIGRDLIQNPRKKLTPTVKMMMRTSLKVIELSREWMSHLGELLQDAYAEVREDLREANQETHAKHQTKPQVKSKNSAARRPLKHKDVKKDQTIQDNIIHLNEQRQPQ